MQSGPACSVLSLVGSPFEIGLLQAEFILLNPTFSNMVSLRRWQALDSTQGKMLAHALSRWNPFLLDETEGLARGLGVSPYSILASWYPRPPEERAGCTLVAAASDSSLIAGRNFDIGYSRIDIRVLKTRPEGLLVSVGCGGWLGRFDGLNSAGLAVAMATVEVAGSHHTVPQTGSIPPSMLIRTLLDSATTTDAAVQLIATVPGWSPVNYLVVDAAGDAAVIERDAGWFRVRRPVDGVVAATNHFIGQQGRHGSTERYAAVVSRRASDLSTVEDMKRLLTQLASPRLTRWTEVFLPLNKEVHFSGGHGASYKLFNLGDKC